MVTGILVGLIGIIPGCSVPFHLADASGVVGMVSALPIHDGDPVTVEMVGTSTGALTSLTGRMVPIEKRGEAGKPLPRGDSMQLGNPAQVPPHMVANAKDVKVQFAEAVGPVTYSCLSR